MDLSVIILELEEKWKKIEERVADQIREEKNGRKLQNHVNLKDRESYEGLFYL